MNGFRRSIYRNSDAIGKGEKIKDDIGTDDSTVGGRHAGQYTDFYSDIAVFSAAWNGRSIRENVKEQSDTDNHKRLYIGDARNTADAAAHGGLFRPVLSVSD